MYIILTENGPTSYSIAQLKRDYPHVSFPYVPSNDLLAQYNVFQVVKTNPPVYDSAMQNLTEGTPEYNSGVWTQVWSVTNATLEEIEQRKAGLAYSMRAQRDQLLAETDWIVSRSYESGEPVPTRWATYRQSLRDITLQDGFPYSVIWPTKE